MRHCLIKLYFCRRLIENIIRETQFDGSHGVERIIHTHKNTSQVSHKFTRETAALINKIPNVVCVISHFILYFVEILLREVVLASYDNCLNSFYF